MRTIPALLDDAFLLLRRAWRPTAVVVLLVLGTLEAVQGLLSGLVFGGDTSATGATLLDGDLPALSAALVGLAVVVLLTLLITPVLGGGVTWLLLELDRGRTHDWRALLRATVVLGPRVLGTTLLTGLVALGILVAAGVVVGLPLLALGQAAPEAAIALGVLALLPVGALLVLATAGLYVAVPVCVAEQQRPAASLRRSWGLLRPLLGRVVAVVLLGGLVLLLVQVGLISAIAIAAELTGPFGFALQALGGIVGSLLLVPLNAALGLLVLADARTRREGADVARLVDAVGRPGGGSAVRA
ncbi:MAG: hypothetical protein ACLGIR_02490 [Actinomycetes bacterium]